MWSFDDYLKQQIFAIQTSHIIGTTSASPPAITSFAILDEDADDATLIEALQQGPLARSNHAFRIIYDNCHQKLKTYIINRVSSEDDADDVASQTWIIALRKIHKFEYEGIPILGWLYRIANFKIKEFRRANPTNLSFEELEENQTQILNEALTFIMARLDLSEVSSEMIEVAPEIQKEADKVLHKLLKKLPKAQRNILWLQYFEGVDTDEEIGKRLGINKNSVKVYRHRAKSRLFNSTELSKLFSGDET